MNSLRQDMNLGWKRVESGWLYFILVMFSRALVKHQRLSDVRGGSRPMPGTDNKIYEFPERVILRANEKNRG